MEKSAYGDHVGGGILAGKPKASRFSPALWRRLGVVLGMLVPLSVLGCAATPYRCGGCLYTGCDVGLKSGEPQVEYGRPAPVIDAVGWVVGIPAKLLMLNHRVANHNVSIETDMALQEYLAQNGLDKVKVRVNQYDPCGEWERLVQNESVCWPIRYTFGTLSVVGYTLLPGRIFGDDQYNPYTNTVYLYSDVPAIGLYLGGHAKDYAQRPYKGLHAVAYLVPGVNVIHEARAANDALGYLRTFGTPEEIRDGYLAIDPAFAVRSSLPLMSVGVNVILPSAIAGHLVGHCQAAAVPEEMCPPEPTIPAVTLHDLDCAPPDIRFSSRL